MSHVINTLALESAYELAQTEGFLPEQAERFAKEVIEAGIDPRYWKKFLLEAFGVESDYLTYQRSELVGR